MIPLLWAAVVTANVAALADIQCSQRAQSSVECFVELTAALNSNEDVGQLAPSAGGVELFDASGGRIAAVVGVDAWPRVRVMGGPAISYSNAFHSQTSTFACTSNCCPSNGMFINNVLYPNATVVYYCAPPTVVVVPEHWKVAAQLLVTGGANISVSARMDPLGMATMDNSSRLCVPTQTGSYSPSELKYLTDPFLVPETFFGPSVHHIGMTHVSFAEAFNCSQVPRGYLTALLNGSTANTSCGLGEAVYDQFAPFRTASLLSAALSYRSTVATYVSSTYNAATGALQSTLRLEGPLHITLDATMGISRPLSLVAPVLSVIFASISGTGVGAVQLAPAYRTATPNVPTQVVVACALTTVLKHCTLCIPVDMGSLSTGDVRVCVESMPLRSATNMSWEVVSNRTVTGVLPEDPLVIRVPLAAPDHLTCRVRVQCAACNASFLDVWIHASVNVSSVDEHSGYYVDATLAMQRIAFVQSPGALCPAGLDESVPFSATGCTPLTDALCRSRYANIQMQYSMSVRRCAPLQPLETPMPVPFILSLGDDDTVAPQSTEAPRIAVFPWMTAAWRLNINTSTVCGAHGVWNETTWWCDCDTAWGTDYSQDPWGASTYSWCSTPTQWLTPSPGSWEGGSGGFLSFASAWNSRIANGDAKTIAVTAAGSLVCLALLALVLQGVWIVIVPQGKNDRHRRAIRRRRRPRTRRLEAAPAPLQLQWHRSEPFSHQQSTSSSSSAPHPRHARVEMVPREEIEVESTAFSTSTGSNDTEVTCPTSIASSSHRSKGYRSWRKQGRSG